MSKRKENNRAYLADCSLPNWSDFLEIIQANRALRMRDRFKEKKQKRKEKKQKK